MQSELDDFLSYCRLERRLAPLTCRAYERDIRALLGLLEGIEIADLAAVRTPDLRAFIVAEAERRPAVGSQARTVAGLRLFSRFCLENEYLQRDPAQVLHTPKKREALPDVLDRRKLIRLLAAADTADVWQRQFQGRQERDRLLLALFAYAGLRRDPSRRTGRGTSSQGLPACFPARCARSFSLRQVLPEFPRRRRGRALAVR